MRRYDMAGQFGQHGYAAQAALHQQQDYSYGGGYTQPLLFAETQPSHSGGGDNQRADDGRGDQAVAVFDKVGGGHCRQQAAIAQGPVAAAAEAGSCNPHYAAEDYQGKGGYYRGPGQAAQPAAG